MAAQFPEKIVGPDFEVDISLKPTVPPPPPPPPPRPSSPNKTLWFFMFGTDPSTNVPLDTLNMGFNRACIKALDGSAWEGQFDTSADGVHSVADLTAWYNAFKAQGLGMDVYVNVLDNDPAELAQYKAIDAAMPADVRLVLDLEPYAGFFGSGDPGNAIRLISATVGRERLALSFDPRRLGWVSAYFDYFSVLMPQCYGPGWDGFLLSVANGRTWEPTFSNADAVTDWRAMFNGPVFSGRNTGFGVWLQSVNALQQAFVKGG